MRRIAWCVLVWTTALMAADVTGTWKGHFIVNRPNGSTAEAPACLILKQNGSEVSGATAGV